MEVNNEHFDQEIRKKMEDLDKTYPASLPQPDKLWNAILARRKNKRLHRIRKQWSVAASFMVLVMSGILWYMMSSPVKEAIPERPGYTLTSAPEKEVLEYINKLCQGNHIACASPGFKELQAELEETSSKLLEVNRQLALFGNDARLIRAKTRIENHRASILREIVQIL